MLSNKVFISKILLAGILTFFFFIFELAFYNLLYRSLEAITIFDFYFWQILVISIYLIQFYLVFNSRYFRGSLSIFYSVLSLVIIGIFIFVYQYTIIDMILGFGLLLSLFSYLIVKKFLRFPTLSLVLGISTLILFGVLCYFFLLNFFFITKLIFIILSILSVMSLKLSYTYQDVSSSPMTYKRLKWYFRIALVSIPVISASWLFLPIRTVEIDPEGRPELVFWSSAIELPRGDDVLEDCYEYGITFAVVLRVNYIDDGGYSEASRIQNLIDHGIYYYVVIGGRSGSFYCSLENAEEFIEDLRYIRNWLINNSLYYYVKGICVDAESPSDYFDKFEDDDVTSTGEYFVKNLPTERTIRKAQEKMEDFINLIHEDGKEAIIIMNPAYLDEEDEDHDQSLLAKTIYSLDLKWDASVAMLYRTARIPSPFDYVLYGLKDYHEIQSDYDVEYYETEKEDKYTMPLSEFYLKVSLELSGSAVDVEEDDRYIFIGNFHRRNRHTTYIKEKEYRKDLDICKHFKVGKVWLYEWSTFKSRYGEDEVGKLGRYNKKNEKWILTYPAFSLNRELLYILIIVIADRFLYLEYSL